MTAAIRPMLHDDVQTADEIWRAAFASSNTDATEDSRTRSLEDAASNQSRLHYLIDSDPNGAFVAEHGDNVVGLCQSLRRNHRFVLARLAVSPAYQEQGLGRLLLTSAFSYAEGATEQYIWSSRDPRAMHSYVREGFTLRPTMQLTGRERLHTIPHSVRVATESEIDVADSVDAMMRGETRHEDLQFWLDGGGKLVLDDDGGYLVINRTRLTALCATSIPVAQRLLETVLSGYLEFPPLEVGWVVAEQQWAIESAARCGATLANYGAMLTRNVEILPVPYLPNALLG